MYQGTFTTTESSQANDQSVWLGYKKKHLEESKESVAHVTLTSASSNAVQGHFAPTPRDRMNRKEIDVLCLISRPRLAIVEMATTALAPILTTAGLVSTPSLIKLLQECFNHSSSNL